MDQNLKFVISAEANGVVQTFNNTGKALDNFKKGSNEATQSLINLSRVAQDAPYGFIGIANNLNPLLESFQRLKAEAGGGKAALSALTAGLSGPAGIGLALGVASSLLVTFGDKLFGSKGQIEENTLALAAFNKEIEDSKKKLDDMSSALDYANKRGKLNVEIAFGKGPDSGLVDLREQSIANRDFIEKLKKEEDNAGKKLSEIQTRLIQSLSQDQLEAFDKDLLGSLAESLPKEVKTLFDAYEAAQKSHLEKQKKLDEARKQQGFIYQQIQLQKVDVQEEANKKQEELDAKNLAARKKALAAQKLIDDEYFRHLKEMRTSFISADRLESPFFFEEKPKGDTQFDKFFKNKLQSQTVTRKSPFDFGIDKTTISDMEKMIKNIEKARKAADAMGEALSGAFQDFFSAMIGGKNPIKAFFESLGQSVIKFIAQLIQAQIQAALLGIITNILTGGTASGLSAAGRVTHIPTSGLFGGGGINVARGSGFGNIAGLSGGSGGNFQVATTIRGSDLQLIMSRSGKNQRRNG